MTAIDTRAAGVTVNTVDPLTPVPESVAVIAVTPIDALVARPSVPDALLTLATPALEELQVTEVVRSCVELSE